MTRSTFHYVTYIRTTSEKLCSALTTDVEFMKQYWFGTHCESNRTAGSSWKMVSHGGSVTDAGEVVEADPPRRLVIRWHHEMNPELKAEGDSLCTMELEPSGFAVKLSILHTIEREPSKLIGAVSGGWPLQSEVAAGNRLDRPERFWKEVGPPKSPDEHLPSRRSWKNAQHSPPRRYRR